MSTDEELAETPPVPPCCGGTRRSFTTRITESGQVVIDQYGQCVECCGSFGPTQAERRAQAIAAGGMWL